MKELHIGDLTLGRGVPNICTPLVGADFDLVLDAYEKVKDAPVDLFEWRTDYLLGDKYQDMDGINKTILALSERDRRPVILTLRTEEAGGKLAIPAREYKETIRKYVMDSAARIVDIDPFDREKGFDRDVMEFLVEMAHENGKRVILSNHDFSGTPDKGEIVKRIMAMAEIGGDIPKVAYMPKTDEDVKNLLEAAKEASAKLDSPVIAISMGEMGKASRICGGTFGSCITFGANKLVETAPGQIPADELRECLNRYYR